MRGSSGKASFWAVLAPGARNLRAYQVLVLVLVFGGWYILTSPTLLPPIYFDDANKAAFFFGEPQKVLGRIWAWFASGEIYRHLWVTLIETFLAFAIGTVLGVGDRHLACPRAFCFGHF